MGFRYRKSFKAAPGVKINLSKSGPSLTLGGKTARTTINPGRKTITNSARTGITGLSYTKTNSIRSKKSKRQSVDTGRRPSDAPLKDNLFVDDGGAGQNKPPRGCLFWGLAIFFWPISLSVLLYRRIRNSHSAFYCFCTAVLSAIGLTLLGLIVFTFACMPFVDTSETSSDPVLEVVATAEPSPEPTAVVTATPTPSPEPTATPSPEPTEEPTPTPEPTEQLVWISQTGSRYHAKSSCSSMVDPWQVTLSEALAMELEPCGHCY